MGGLSTPPMTAAQIGAKVATLAVGAVGTYAQGRNLTGGDIATGNTLAGSNLGYSTSLGDYSSASTGTWRCMGYCVAASGLTTVWMRIA